MWRWIVSKLAGPVEPAAPVDNVADRPMAARSPGWPAVRDAHLRKHGTCEACGSTRALTVHHKIPFSLDPSRELDPTNLITLCEGEVVNCHLLFGHSRDWKAFNPHVVEDAAQALLRLRRRRYTV
jgi:hypothetical protein